MTTYADFDPGERRILLSSLEAAAIAISTASLGRKEETVSEGYAAADHVLKSRDAYIANALVSSVILELEREAREGRRFPDYLEVATAEGAQDRAYERLREVVALLDGKATPEEAAGYKGWLMEIATVAARAGKEDQGFLGTGGVLVNDAERAALDAIARLLGVEPPPL